MSSDPENEYLSDGLTEDLIMAFSRLKGLRVPARTSSFAFKGKNEDICRIGQQLNVTKILEGSVRKVGDRLRITAQLINVADGDHLWAQHVRSPNARGLCDSGRDYARNRKRT